MSIPLWLKLAYTAFVVVLVPVYWRNYGVTNFLWFSDIALITTVIALWTGNRLLASMMAVAVLLPELVWNVAYFGRLLTGYRFGGIVEYMFDPTKPWNLRSLSLFHIFLPLVLIFLVGRLGYDARAWWAMTALAAVVLPISYLVSTRTENINWVYGLGAPQNALPPLAWLGTLMLILPLVVYVPTHFLLNAVFRR